MTIHWKVVEQYIAVVLFVLQFCPVWNFRKFISCGLGTVRSERVKRFETWRSSVILSSNRENENAMSFRRPERGNAMSFTRQEVGNAPTLFSSPPVVTLVILDLECWSEIALLDEKCLLKEDKGHCAHCECWFAVYQSPPPHGRYAGVTRVSHRNS